MGVPSASSSDWREARGWRTVLPLRACFCHVVVVTWPVPRRQVDRHGISLAGRWDVRTRLLRGRRSPTGSSAWPVSGGRAGFISRGMGKTLSGKPSILRLVFIQDRKELFVTFPKHKQTDSQKFIQRRSVDIIQLSGVSLRLRTSCAQLPQKTIPDHVAQAATLCALQKGLAAGLRGVRDDHLRLGRLLLRAGEGMPRASCCSAMSSRQQRHNHKEQDSIRQCQDGYGHKGLWCVNQVKSKGVKWVAGVINERVCVCIRGRSCTCLCMLSCCVNIR